MMMRRDIFLQLLNWNIFDNSLW